MFGGVRGCHLGDVQRNIDKGERGRLWVLLMALEGREFHKYFGELFMGVVA